MSKWLTNEQLNAICELYMDGWKVKQIADYLKVQPSRVYKNISKMQLKQQRKKYINEILKQRKGIHP